MSNERALKKKKWRDKKDPGKNGKASPSANQENQVVSIGAIRKQAQKGCTKGQGRILPLTT